MKRMEIGVGHVSVSAAAKRLVRRTLDDNRLTYGPLSREFERRFAEAHDARFAILSNSGTSSLHTAVAALAEARRWKPGDEVVVPALTFVATANVVLAQGFTPVFADADPNTWNVDPGRMEEAVGRRTRALLPAHLFGQPCEMGPIAALARSKRLALIEDSCETMFARTRGRSVGSFGDVGCFSTYSCHLLVTGVGGLALTDDPGLAVVLRSLVNHGRDSIYFSIDDDAPGSGKPLKEVVARRFRFVREGFSYRVTEMEAALGLAGLDEMDGWLRRRAANAARLTAGLRDLEEHLQLPWHPEHADHRWMMYPLVLRDERLRRPLCLHLEDRGIETRDLLPLLSQPLYRRLYPEAEKRNPVAARLSRAGFYVGCHPGMGARECAFIVEAMHDFFKRSRR